MHEPAIGRALNGLCAVILIGAALSLARTVFAPVAFALFVIAVVWPVQLQLQKALPKLVALLVTVSATTVIIATFASLIAWGFTRVVRSVIADAARIQAIYAQMAEWLEAHGVVLAGLWAEHVNVRGMLRVLPEVMNRMSEMATFLFVILIYVILGLLEVEDAARRLRLAPRREFGQFLLVASARTAAKLRRFMLVRTVMSLLTGLLVGAFASLAGVALAVEWGVIAFVLNYIPVIGPLVATTFPTLYAMAQFSSWQAGLIVFAGLNLIQFLVGSYLEPRVAGNAVSISPFVLLFSVFFGTFLWGIPGAFIGVPIVIAIVTLCEEHPSSRWLATLVATYGRRVR
ncbi:AI-2E family transporter [Methylobacterium sp. JK268]